MAIDNEELLQKFVRTGMIMRHIDDEGPHGHGKCHGHHGHGHKHGRSGEGAETCGCEAHEVHGQGMEHGSEVEGEARGGKCRHGHGHGHGEGRCRRRGQARVLTMVAMQEGINQKDLAFLLGIRPQTIGEMLRKLEERGLVERRKSEEDARATQVFLTDEGRTRAEEIAERRALAAADMFSVLTDDEKEQLDALLDKLGVELDKHRPKRHCEHAETAQSSQE